MSDSKGLGRFFKADETGDAGSNGVRDYAEADRTISALQARITELEGAVGRPSFIDMDEDALTQIAAEDAAVIIRAARLRAGKLIEQATDTLQQAESEREQIRASCELDARQTREAANVDARKLRAEATATLETARDQAAQLLEATQNDADSQAAENQKVIAKLLEDATRRANEVASEAEALKANVDKDLAAQRAQTEQELATLRANADSELSNLRSETDKSTSAQIAAAQAEAKRLQTEATNAAQAMLEKATGDAQALLAKSTGDARALGEDSSKSHAATIADAQIAIANGTFFDEDLKVQITDIDTFNQLNNFVKHEKETGHILYKAESGHDDIIMTAITATEFFGTTDYADYVEELLDVIEPEKFELMEQVLYKDTDVQGDLQYDIYDLL